MAMLKALDRSELKACRSTSPAHDVVTTDWRQRLPVLGAERVQLRELRLSDAASLLAMLTTEEVTRFISPPPTTIDGFERFITWTESQRAAAEYVCFAVTLRGHDTAIGLFQVRRLDRGFETAEWGFAIGSAFWGTGVFQESAELVLDFVFNTLGVRRLEARVVTKNGRGNGAMLKIGGVQEGILRRSFPRNGHVHDQVLYSILEEDWRASRGAVKLPDRVRVH
jgi:RimJ/RimL family protein N-acetyltransferase